MIVSGVQQSNSVIYMYLFFFKFFFHLHCYRILSRVPCKSFLLIHFKYSSAYMSNSLTIPCLPLFPSTVAAKSLQSCPTLLDGSPPGSPVPGILQARTLEWVAVSFSNAWKWKVKGKSLSRVRLFVTPRTAAYQAPLSMEFSRQEYWGGVPSPSPLPLYTVIIIHSLCLWACFCFA